MTNSNICSAADLLKASEEIASKFGDKDVWWRGHANANWKLQPRVFRGEMQEYSIAYENSLTGNFMRQARLRSDNCPYPGAYSEWLFFMQHYGLPTRLLDWTESMLVATYFAVTHAQSDYGAIWALEPSLLNASQGLSPAIYDPKANQMAGLFREPFEGYSQKPQLAYIAAVGIPEVDIRMLVQSAACTVHGTEKPIEEFADTDTFLYRYEIPADAKAQLKQSLERLSVTEHHLFPDLEHLSAYLRTRKYGKYGKRIRG